MRQFKFVVIAMLVWGNSVFAANMSVQGAPQDLQLITSWMAHLNKFTPGLNVKPLVDLSGAVERASVLNHLQILDGVVRGELPNIPPGHLFDLSCGNIVCGDGVPGNCSVCGDP